MNSNTYKQEVIIKGNGFLSGKYEIEVAVGDPSQVGLWDIPLVKAFLEDDDIQEMTIVSTNIGFVKTIRKQFA